MDSVTTGMRRFFEEEFFDIKVDAETDMFENEVVPVLRDRGIPSLLPSALLSGQVYMAALRYTAG